MGENSDKKPTVILVGADKGGVGKTTITRTLIDYLAMKHVPRRAFDTEAPKGALKRLQIMRDAARSNLFARFQAEISEALENWPQNFLAHARGLLEGEFKRLNQALATRASNQNWLIANARSEGAAK